MFAQKLFRFRGCLVAHKRCVLLSQGLTAAGRVYAAKHSPGAGWGGDLLCLSWVRTDQQGTAGRKHPSA